METFFDPVAHLNSNLLFYNERLSFRSISRKNIGYTSSNPPSKHGKPDPHPTQTSRVTSTSSLGLLSTRHYPSGEGGWPRVSQKPLFNRPPRLM